VSSNFKILLHRNDDNLHMKLSGDFDGTSAYELLNHIGKSCLKFTTIFIHTDCLKKLIPFGLGVFKNNLSNVNAKDTHIIFTGENASRFSSRSLDYNSGAKEKH
jgi:hypothetical protein